METWIGGVFGILAATVIVIVGLQKGVPVLETFWRAVLGAAVGFLLGRLVFGRLGSALMKGEARRNGESGGPPGDKHV
jgi:hypothetical protein